MTRRQVIHKALLKCNGRSIEDMVDMVELALEFADDLATEVQEAKPNPLKAKLERGLNPPRESVPVLQKIEERKVEDISDLYDEYIAELPPFVEIKPEGAEKKIKLLVFLTKNENSEKFGGPVLNIRLTAQFRDEQRVMLDEYIVKGSTYIAPEPMLKQLTDRVVMEIESINKPIPTKIPAQYSLDKSSEIGNF